MFSTLLVWLFVGWCWQIIYDVIGLMVSNNVTVYNASPIKNHILSRVQMAELKYYTSALHLLLTYWLAYTILIKLKFRR